MHSYRRTASDQILPRKHEVRIDAHIPVIVPYRPSAVRILTQSIDLIRVWIGTGGKHVPVSNICQVKISS